MKEQDWAAIFGDGYVVNLTNGERRCFALDPLDPSWDMQRFCYQSEQRCTRLTVFFSGATIVKVIDEEICVRPARGRMGERVTLALLKQNGSVRCMERYEEYDTELVTQERRLLLPLTGRGKPRALTASAIRSVEPFGCHLLVKMERREQRGPRRCAIFLTNRRAAQKFPIGEREAIEAIDNDEDFHAFARQYMDTCPPDYFERLAAFRNAEKTTVKYRPGDVFRMAYDRTHWCYGLIVCDVKRLRSLPEMPARSTLHCLMQVPVIVRLYDLLTDRPDMTPEELRAYPLGRAFACADNEIIWGTHPVIGHRKLTAEDIELPLIVGAWRRRLLRYEGTDEPVDIPVEWGLCSTVIPHERVPEDLQKHLEGYRTPHGGILIGIPPEYAVRDEGYRSLPCYQNDLLNPHNDDLRGELLRLAGLPSDAGFDDFAAAFGGLTRQEIADRMQNTSVD